MLLGVSGPFRREESMGNQRVTYSTRFASFSVTFIALTRAAARSDGEAFTSHTVLFASCPSRQSGYRKARPDLAARAAVRIHVDGDTGFIVIKYKKPKYYPMKLVNGYLESQI
jgi:hypothetical protein